MRTQGHSNGFSSVLDMRITALCSSSANFLRIPPNSLPQASIPLVFRPRVCCLQRKHIPNFTPADGHNSCADGTLDPRIPTHSVSTANEDHRKNSNSTAEMLSRLKKYGMSGILSYGLLNTVYYTCTFLFVWLYVTPAPGRMGYVAAVERFLKTFAMVWAGSQVTKIVRAGGALALAPFVDRGLSWFTIRFKFESKGKAFITIVGLCFGIAFLMFLLLTLLWA